MTETIIESYKAEMRDSVCPACLYFDADHESPGQCVHEISGQCSVFSHLDELVEVVSTVDSGSIDDYVEALRRRICANCAHQNGRGVCDLRDSRDPVPEWCTLDAHFNIIVGVIEEIQKASVLRS
jgi:hypothetical protein